MALFRRKGKDVTPPASKTASPAERRRQRFEWPPLAALGVLLLSVLVALGVLWVLLLQPSAGALRDTQVRAWGESQASALRQQLAGLKAELQAAAGDPRLLAALESGDPAQIEQAQRALAHRAGVVQAFLLPTDADTPEESGAAPLNYAALDLAHRAARHDASGTVVEAYRVGQRWLLYLATALPSDPQAPARGVLLMVFDLQRLLAGLPDLPADAGQLQLLQHFDRGPEQLLATRGGPAEGMPVTLPGGNPPWTLRFTPADSASVSPLPLLLAALLLLLGGLVALLVQQRRQQRLLESDAEHLDQLCEELYRGKPIKAASLSLPALDRVARWLSRLPPRQAAANGTEAQSTARRAPAQAAQDWMDPLFQTTDILDIDILEEDQDALGLEAQESHPAMNAMPPSIPANIFRAYDIRGVVGDSLTPQAAYWIGRAIGSESLARGEPDVAVGRDGRLSGPELVEQLIRGVAESGCRVSDIGMVPTPVLYYAANVLAGKSGVMLTGSHNPPDYNGFKIVIAGETLANEQIQALRQRIESGDLASGEGSVEPVEILDDYFTRIRDDIAMAKPLKVVVDCGNGVAGVIAPRLIEALGCTVIPLYCEVDGNFPNHHPDPGKPENLKDLIARVKQEGADLGLAFDGDGDRVGVVTNKGTIVYPDRLLMLFAKDVVSRNPGADIIYDVKCTRRLAKLVSGYGGRPVMWKTGHSLIKKKMKESGALLAGEMSGHVFFKERWYGFDDGIYSAARLLEILSQESRDAEAVFAAFPEDISTPEINVKVTEESKFAIIDALQAKADWGEANLVTLDGVRVDYPKGWGLVRASNTTPVLVLRFEAETEEELERIKQVFRTQINAVAPDISLPF